jgi:transcriptional regulator with XRE-family HTH domain
MDVGQRVGANVKRLRKAQRLSQEELAARSGLDRTYVSQIERAVKNVTIVSLDKVARALGVPLTELVA